MTIWDDDTPLPLVGQGRTREDVESAGRALAACVGLLVLLGVARVGAELVLWIVARIWR